MNQLEIQTIDNLKAEVNFRKKLAIQHVTGERLLPDYYNKPAHDKLLLERIEKTQQEISKLAQSITLSPFIELGAERCQRSLVLTNDFKAQGFAVDISFEQLRTAKYFAQLFNRPLLPIRVCCDANNLPFRSESFAFAFSYEFLHHFPTPRPILKEIYRILYKGHFFFSEEPFKRKKVVLYRQKNRIYSDVNLKKKKLIRFIESFISEPFCEEVEHGIIENEDIRLKEWIKSLNIFENKEVFLNSAGIKSRLGNGIRLRNIPNFLLGGEIKGLCSKDNSGLGGNRVSLLNSLICPECSLNNKHLLNPPILDQKSCYLECTICSTRYPVIDDVIILLPKSLMEQLYPEFIL